MQPHLTKNTQFGFATAITAITSKYCDKICFLCLRNNQLGFLDGDFFDLRVIHLPLTWPPLGNCGVFWFKLVSGHFIRLHQTKPALDGSPPLFRLRSAKALKGLSRETGRCSFFINR
jgi:hypothetical protein